MFGSNAIEDITYAIDNPLYQCEDGGDFGMLAIVGHTGHWTPL